MRSQTLVVLNASKELPHAEAERWANAMKRGFEGDFAPYWNVSADVVTVTAPEFESPKDWGIALVDGELGDYLGEHHVDGVPRGVVALGSCVKDRVAPSSVLDHEGKELLGDPLATLAHEGEDGTLYAYEACDPCEGGAGSYKIDGVELEDFVLPLAYFMGLGEKYDFQGILHGPRSIGPGGYQLIKPPGAAWQQVTGERARASRRAPKPWSRRARRILRGSTPCR